MPVVFMFPGQSSRYPGMFDKLLEMDSKNLHLLQKASDLLGRDLVKHYSLANQEQMFATNRDVQVGVFLANHMFLQMIEAQGITATFSCGLSLGEWNHLVHIGAISLDRAILAVDRRGQAYDAGPLGAMASFFPVSLEDLEPIIEKARAFGELEAVNLNSPRQHVLAGEHAALDEAIRLADDELYIEGVIIERQVPMHASMFAPVGKEFRSYLEGIPFQSPNLPYLPNRLGRFVEQADSKTLVDMLSTHVHKPVLWRASIDFLMEQQPDSILVEVGAKAVLHNLLDRKWHKGVKKFKTDSREETSAHLQSVVESIQALLLARSKAESTTDTLRA